MGAVLLLLFLAHKHKAAGKKIEAKQCKRLQQCHDLLLLLFCIFIYCLLLFYLLFLFKFLILLLLWCTVAAWTKRHLHQVNLTTVSKFEPRAKFLSTLLTFVWVYICHTAFPGALKLALAHQARLYVYVIWFSVT